MCPSVSLLHVCWLRCCGCRKTIWEWSQPPLPEHIGFTPSSIFIPRLSIDSTPPGTCRLLRPMRYRGARRDSFGILGMYIFGKILTLPISFSNRETCLGSKETLNTSSRNFNAQSFGLEEGTFLVKKTLDTLSWCFIAPFLALKKKRWSWNLCRNPTMWEVKQTSPQTQINCTPQWIMDSHSKRVERASSDYCS